MQSEWNTDICTHFAPSSSFQSWFRHSNYNSFQRQLNIYGFSRFPEGRDRDSYFHKHFVRGKAERAWRIGRNAVKGTRVRRPSDSAAFPDFYTARDGGESDDPASSVDVALPTAPRISDREIPPSDVVASLMQQGIIPFSSDPSNNQHYQRAGLNLPAATAASGNLNNSYGAPRMMDSNFEPTLAETIGATAAAWNTAHFLPPLGPSVSLESTLFPSIMLSPSQVVEQMMTTQVLIHALQQQLLRHPETEMLQEHERLMRIHRHNLPPPPPSGLSFTVPTLEIVADLIRQHPQFNPNGATL